MCGCGQTRSNGDTSAQVAAQQANGQRAQVEPPVAPVDQSTVKAALANSRG